jgi:hypothetical protein
MRDDKSGSILARSAMAFACAPLTIGKRATILAMLLVYHSTISAKADGCPSIKDEISTDRPDITNSSVVILPRAVCKSRTASISARETAIELLMAQIRACALKLQAVSNFSWIRRHILQMSAVHKIPVFPM